MLRSFSIKYPALITVIPLACGICISYFTGIRLFFLPEWFQYLILFSITVFIIILYNKKTKGELFMFPYLMLLVFFGFFSLQFSFFKTDNDNISQSISSGPVNSIIKGIVIERPEITDERIRVLLEINGLNGSFKNGRIFATVYKNKFKDELACQKINPFSNQKMSNH